MPGSVMAMGRLNRPAIMVYGGIHSGKWKGESLNIVSAFEALGKFNNTITPEDFKGVIQNACPGAVPAEECIQLIPCLRPSKL
jgi:dihydroxy-acid dehydratase